MIVKLEPIERSFFQLKMIQISFADLYCGRLRREQTSFYLTRHLGEYRIANRVLPALIRNFESEKIAYEPQAKGNDLLAAEAARIDVKLLPIDRVFREDQLMNVADPTEPFPTMSRAVQAKIDQQVIDAECRQTRPGQLDRLERWSTFLPIFTDGRIVD